MMLVTLCATIVSASYYVSIGEVKNIDQKFDKPKDHNAEDTFLVPEFKKKIHLTDASAEGDFMKETDIDGETLMEETGTAKLDAEVVEEETTLDEMSLKEEKRTGTAAFDWRKLMAAFVQEDILSQIQREVTFDKIALDKALDKAENYDYATWLKDWKGKDSIFNNFIGNNFNNFKNFINFRSKYRRVRFELQEKGKENYDKYDKKNKNAPYYFACAWPYARYRFSVRVLSEIIKIWVKVEIYKAEDGWKNKVDAGLRRRLVAWFSMGVIESSDIDVLLNSDDFVVNYGKLLEKGLNKYKKYKKGGEGGWEYVQYMFANRVLTKIEKKIIEIGWGIKEKKE